MPELNERTYHAIVESQPVQTTEGRSAGELAADVFACFDKQMAPTQIVARLAVPPEQLETLWRAWAKFRGNVLLFPETLSAVADALSGVRTTITATAIVEATLALSAEAPRVCRQCGTQWAEFCDLCPRDAALEAAAARPTARAKRRARLE